MDPDHKKAPRLDGVEGGQAAKPTLKTWHQSGKRSRREFRSIGEIIPHVIRDINRGVNYVSR